MQEEIEQKSFNIMISTTKLSARTVLRAVKAAFRLYQSKASQGKQSVRTLLRQNRGVSSVEISKTGIRDLERYAKKYGIDYAIRKDTSEVPPRYLVFFKAPDAEAFNSAFKEYIRNFNNLDVPGSEGNEKQFVVLVEKGKEGWNCRSLFGVALYRSPKSKIFVLQATMRCLRVITDERLTATVFLSKENYDTLDDELHKNFNMEISDIKNTSTDDRHKYQVRVLPPPRSIRLKRVWHEYNVSSKEYSTPVDFGLAGADLSKYSSVMYERDSIANDTSTKQSNADEYQVKMQYSAFSLAGEVARYLNISSILAAKILREAQDGMDVILADVNRYNAVLDDIIIPTIFHALFDVTAIQKTEDRDVVLLREPKDAAYYEFSAKDDLVITNKYPGFTPDEVLKSFHADTYCFDSLPEKECFFQYIKSDKVQEVYFTGMFTSNQGDLSVYYYDPESGRIRQYYPDFLAKMKDGTYQLIEVKGDNKIDDVVVQAKKEAALEMAAASGIKYEMYAGSTIMKTHILESLPVQQTNLLL